MPPLHIDTIQLEDEQSGSLISASPESVVTLSYSSSGVNPVRIQSCESLEDEQFIQQAIASLLKKKLIQPSKFPSPISRSA